jgi:hypothetical protein
VLLDVNGAWPTQPTPSPPMWLISEVPAVRHPDRHAVTADAGHGAACLRHARRRVVRAAEQK